jgi:hypothetical protein
MGAAIALHTLQSRFLPRRAFPPEPVAYLPVEHQPWTRWSVGNGFRVDRLVGYDGDGVDVRRWIDLGNRVVIREWLDVRWR